MTTISIIQGPNLNLLGERETQIYGNWTLKDLHKEITAHYPGNDIRTFQSNHEGAIIDAIHECRTWAEGIILNAGAYTHTSYAIRDAISAAKVPCIEVHISNVYAREDFRHHSVIAPACLGQISGLGKSGYFLAVAHFLSLGKEKTAGTII